MFRFCCSSFTDHEKSSKDPLIVVTDALAPISDLQATVAKIATRLEVLETRFDIQEVAQSDVQASIAGLKEALCDLTALLSDLSSPSLSELKASHSELSMHVKSFDVSVCDVLTQDDSLKLPAPTKIREVDDLLKARTDASMSTNEYADWKSGLDSIEIRDSLTPHWAEAVLKTPRIHEMTAARANKPTISSYHHARATNQDAMTCRAINKSPLERIHRRVRKNCWT